MFKKKQKDDFIGISYREIKSDEDYDTLKKLIDCRIIKELGGNRKQALFEIRKRINELNEKKEHKLSIELPVGIFFMSGILSPIVNYILLVKFSSWGEYRILIMLGLVLFIVVILEVILNFIMKNNIKQMKFYNAIESIIKQDLNDKGELVRCSCDKTEQITNLLLKMIRHIFV